MYPVVLLEPCPVYLGYLEQWVAGRYIVGSGEEGGEKVVGVNLVCVIVPVRIWI